MPACVNLSDDVGTCQNQMTWYDNASEGCNVSSTETNHKSMWKKAITVLDNDFLDLCICVKYCKKENVMI